MEREQPLVSIIVITYNSSKYVLETLESAKNQIYQNIELIVTDDGSQDDTVEICRNWLKENDTYFVRTKLITVEKNTGIPANCNRGLKAAQGEWIKSIAGDDILYNSIIETYINIVKTKSDVNVIHSNVQKFYDVFEEKNYIEEKSTENLKFNTESISSQDQFQILLRVNPIFAPTVLIRRNLFDKYGFFDEKYHFWEDRPMWLNLTKNNIKFHFVHTKTVFYRIHSHSVTAKEAGLFSIFDVKKEQYLLDFYKYLPLYERVLKIVEYHRKKILLNNNLSKINLMNKIINKTTGLFTYKTIRKIDNSYK